MGPPNPETDTVSAGATQPLDPRREEIEALAYQIWEQEGRPEGQSSEHWRQAESLLQAQRLQAG